MKANPQSAPAYGTTASILAANPNDYGVGAILISSNERRAWLVRFDAGIAANYLEPIVVADGQPYTTPGNLTVYVATTGNDANDGLTPATAVLTLNQALIIVGTTGYTLTCLISVGAGVFPMPVTVGITVGLNGTGIVIPMCKGGNSRTALPPIIRGTMTTLAADSVFAVTPGAAPTFSTIQLTVGGYAVNQFANTWMRVTSGTRTLAKILVVSNTVNTLTLAGTYTAGELPIAGDTVEMEDTSTIFRWTSPTNTTQNVSLYGDQAWIDAIDFQSEVTGGAGASLGSYLSALSLTRCKFRGQTLGGWAISLGRNAILRLGSVPAAFGDETALVPSGQLGGCVLKPTTGAMSFNAASGGGQIVISGSVVDQCNFSATGGLLDISRSMLTTSAIRATRRGTVASLSDVRMSTSNGLTQAIGGVTYKAALLAALGGQIFTTDCDISTSVAGCDGVCTAEDGHASIAGILTSALGNNGGFGVNCRKRSRVQVDLPNTSVTINGTSGNVQVGANAAAATWAQILAGLAVNINDLAAAAPTQICYVSQ